MNPSGDNNLTPVPATPCFTSNSICRRANGALIAVFPLVAFVKWPDVVGLGRRRWQMILYKGPQRQVGMQAVFLAGLVLSGKLFFFSKVVPRRLSHKLIDV